MTFGRKYAGATYQRLMEKVFAEQIGKKVEVYVDDMAIKSRSESTLLQDVKETLQILAWAQMKLNLGKCTFGVEEDQFLGYWITKEGMKPNQVKIQKFLDSKPHIGT